MMWRAGRRPWLTVLIAAALVLAVGIGMSTQVPATSVRAGGDPVVMTAGDIACGTDSTGSCYQNSTESAIATVNPDAVLPLGDEQYECGDLTDFNAYYAPSWGQSKAVTHPATGNHEYNSSTDRDNPCYNRPSGAAGYYAYFGNAASPLDSNCTSNCKGYYSFDLGAWHIIALNAQCAYVSCAAGSPQEQWLKADLAAHPSTCTLAFWHQARWSSGGSGNLAAYDAFWQDLYAAGADVILTAHDHDYERFAPQDPSENLDLVYGIREFVVGTGGRNLSSFYTIQPNSELRQSGTFGVLKLTLHASSYDWQFMRTSGQPMPNGDSGTTSCSTSIPPTPTPVPTTVPGTVLFSDGFESGNLSAWSPVQSGADGAATVQSSVVKSGSDAAQLSETSTAGSFADARRTLSPTQADLTASGDFQISQEGASGGNVPIFRLYDPSGTRLISLYRQNQSGNKLYVGYGGSNYLLSGTLPLGTWAHFDVHVTTAGAASTVEVWLNGTRVYQTSTASLGTAAVATVQIGNDTKAQTFTLVADNVSVNAGPPTSTATSTPVPPTATTTPTATGVPSTSTPAPPGTTTTPTATGVPSTSTPAPTATNTPVPTATNTPVPPTATPTVAAAPTTVLFSDGFESGNFSAWSAVKTTGGGSASVQRIVVKSGTYAAKLAETSSNGAYAYVRKTLSVAQMDLTASGDFQISQEGASGGSIPILRLYDPSGTQLINLFRQNQSGNQLYVGHGGTNYLLTGTLPLNTWAHCDVHVTTGGTGASTVEVWLNGTQVYQTSTASLGTAGVATVQIGNETKGQSGTVYADNVSVNTGAPPPTPNPTP